MEISFSAAGPSGSSIQAFNSFINISDGSAHMYTIHNDSFIKVRRLR